MLSPTGAQVRSLDTRPAGTAGNLVLEIVMLDIHVL